MGVLWSNKRQKSTKKGLNKINSLKSKLKDINVTIFENNSQDLVNIFDLQSPLLSAEATIISALERNESRGAHQRADFKEENSACQFNCCVKTDDINQNIEVYRLPLKKLNNELKILVDNQIRDEDIGNKLLENSKI